MNDYGASANNDDSASYGTNNTNKDNKNNDSSSAKNTNNPANNTKQMTTVQMTTVQVPAMMVPVPTTVLTTPTTTAPTTMAATTKKPAATTMPLVVPVQWTPPITPTMMAPAPTMPTMCSTTNNANNTTNNGTSANDDGTSNNNDGTSNDGTLPKWCQRQCQEQWNQHYQCHQYQWWQCCKKHQQHQQPLPTTLTNNGASASKDGSTNDGASASHTVPACNNVEIMQLTACGMLLHWPLVNCCLLVFALMSLSCRHCHLSLSSLALVIVIIEWCNHQHHSYDVICMQWQKGKMMKNHVCSNHVIQMVAKWTMLHPILWRLHFLKISYIEA